MNRLDDRMNNCLHVPAVILKLNLAYLKDPGSISFKTGDALSDQAFLNRFENNMFSVIIYLFINITHYAFIFK